MAQVTYTKENDKWYADFDNRKKTLWKERWINPIDMPEPTPSVTKGEIITMNLDGTDKQYRVLKVDGNVAEVLSMSDGLSSAFDSNNFNFYSTKTLDIYLNNTYYNTLTSTAKEAIVDKTFRQDSWYFDSSGNPSYRGVRTNGNYQISLATATYGAEITKHIYALSVQDIIEYLEVTPEMSYENTTLTTTNLWKMFWDDEVAHSGIYIWTQSAFAGVSTRAFNVSGPGGRLDYGDANAIQAVRPAFQIDLTKIEWTPTTK